jgi:SOS-response transcriptional repressor LexA
LFGIRLKAFADEKFGSITAMSKVIGISQPNIARYVKEEVQPTKILFEKLLEVGCDIEWLLTGKSKEADKQTGVKQFPLVSMVGAGSVIPYDDVAPIMIPFPYAGNGLVIKVSGDSMATLISDNDLVLVDIDKRPRLGHIVAVRTKQGEQFIKYLGAYNEDIVLFYSHNAYYSPITIDKKDILTIKKVVLILKDVDYPDNIQKK